MPQFPVPLAPRRKRRGWVTVGIVAVVLCGASIAWLQRVGKPGDGPASAERAMLSPDDTTARPPAGTRVRVRVVNATATRGLARRATMLLRDFGFDVLDFDTDGRRRDATLIQVHTGETDIAQRIIRVLGVGTITSIPDSLRYLDVTVVIGRDWQPPAQPLRP